MAYYDNNSWSASPAGRQGPWDPAGPPSRPGTTQAGPPEDGEAFYYQFASVDRAVETWRKSSKLPADPRMSMGGQRFPPANEFDPMRPVSGGHVQGYIATQRFGGASVGGGGGGRPTEGDPSMQAKRRMAAQRERELRNFHQEQQFQKHVSGPKSDRSMSPNTGMTEEERRELISRQHRALYGGESSIYNNDPAASRAIPQDARVTAGNVPGAFRTGSGSPYDAFGLQSGGPGNESGISMARDGKEFAPRGQRSRANSTSSPSNANNANATLNVFENPQQQSSRTSNSSPGSSPPQDGSKPPTTSAGNVAPIGTRPATQQQGGPQPSNLQKRSTTPLPSPLSYGFSAEQSQGEKSGNNQDDKTSNNIRGGWGNSGVWGGKGGLGQAKVWG